MWDEMDMGLSRASTRCVTRPAKKAGEEGIGGRTLDRGIGEVFCRQTLLLENIY